jgi:hypothetical protein
MCYAFIFLINNYINLKTIDELVVIYFIVTLLSCVLTIIYHLKNINFFKKIIYFYNKIYLKKKENKIRKMSLKCKCTIVLDFSIGS